MGFREFQEIRGFRGFRGLNGRLTVVDGVDCVYGVSIRVNVNDGNDVGTDRAICLQYSLKCISEINNNFQSLAAITLKNFHPTINPL